MYRGGIEWTEQQTKWLVKHFRNTSNEEVLNELEKRGLKVSLRTMVRKARQLGLDKTKNYMNRINRYALAKLQAHNEATGYAESRLTSKRMWERYRELGTMPSSCYKAGETNLQRLGPKREAERLAKSVAHRNETIKKELRRIELGLEQHTRLMLVRKYDRKEIMLRSSAKKRGYVILKDDSTIYYTKDTRRSAVVERHITQYGLPLMPMSLKGKNMNVAGESMLMAGNMNY